MSDRRGGIPAWQRADYQEERKEPVPRAQDSTDPQNGQSSANTSEGSSLETDADSEIPSKPALNAAHSQQPSQDQHAGHEQNHTPSQSPTKNVYPTTTTSSPPQLRRVPPPSSAAPQPVQSPPASRPPIITYPEHLLQSQKPPPLVTTSRLLNTAYAFAGLAATFYGLSNYLVKPMTESLNAARHDFHAHSLSKLEEFNRRLEGIVSVDPKLGILKAREEQLKDLGDTASEDSDPTELFHRDIGTQTAPEEMPKRPSSEISSDSESPRTPTETQQRQLDRIRTTASTLTSESLSSESQTMHEFRTIAEMLREQLEGIAFPAASDGGSFGFSATGTGFNNLYGTNGASKKDSDEIGKIKQEIRSLKGSLLSARSFPAGGAVAPSRRDLFPAS